MTSHSSCLCLATGCLDEIDGDLELYMVTGGWVQVMIVGGTKIERHTLVKTNKMCLEF